MCCGGILPPFLVTAPRLRVAGIRRRALSCVQSYSRSTRALQVQLRLQLLRPRMRLACLCSRPLRLSLQPSYTPTQSADLRLELGTHSTLCDCGALQLDAAHPLSIALLLRTPCT